jgi:hypothetical protein
VIRLLADENVPGASVLRLRKAGHDRDFGELIYRHGEPAPAGVIYLRFRPADPEEPARIVSAIMERPEIALESRFTVVTRDQIRQRPLPSNQP